MKKLGLNEIREKYLQFFEKKAHLRMKSFPLIPQNDNSLLLINAGMAPLKPYFTGQEIPPSKRVITCQKCIRTGDIENVGKTARHGTFFEMLGNFSFGDYFKNEAIAWAWEFVTHDLGLPEDRLYVSIYENDDEAEKIWHETIGIPKERIFRLGKEDNFWELGLGPCGPCSEIYYDRGEEYGCGSPDCTVGCDCDRYLEFWNLVFTQFDQKADGSYEPLANPNIDTGMGLERLAAMMQEVDSIFDVDTIKAIRDHVCSIADVQYKTDHKKDVSIRVITDHIRSVTFMTSDGILPSNEGRGYVLRRLLRRAVRHGKLLGIQGAFLTKIAETVIKHSKEAYPELEEKQEYIYKILAVEEEKFNQTIDQGMEILKGYMKDLKKNKKTILSGKHAFKLYDTYGFPVDLTKEILEENSLDLDEESFETEMNSQRERARAAREDTNYMGREDTVYNQINTKLSSEFVGYEQLSYSGGEVTAMTTDTEIIEEASQGQKITLIIDITPFYATGGGQQGDIGTIQTETGILVVEDCVKVSGNKVGHIGRVIDGFIQTGQKAELVVDLENRMATARNHSATHLLQKALRNIIGRHVEQAGSHVNGNRLRFDFTHFESISSEDLKKIEKEVNRNILKGLPVQVKEASIEEAREKGAMALFGEKYGEVVRVVEMGGYSIELCGGTHVGNTAQIGSFKILSEVGVASGVRRIEAITGEKTIEYFENQEDELKEISKLVKANPDQVISKIGSILEELQQLHQENEKMKSKLATGMIDDLLNQSKLIEGIQLVTVRNDDLDMNGLRDLGDKMKDKINPGVVVLANGGEEKVNLIIMASKGAVGLGIHAGNMVREVAKVVGGGGGGRPNMAQAGGKEPEKIEAAFVKAEEMIKLQVQS